MRTQILGIGFSLVVHGFAAVVLFGVSQHIPPAKKNVAIDFSIDFDRRPGWEGFRPANEGYVPLPGESESLPVATPHQATGAIPTGEGQPCSVDNVTKHDPPAVQDAPPPKEARSEPPIPNKTVDPVLKRKASPKPSVQAVKNAPPPTLADYRPEQRTRRTDTPPEVLSASRKDAHGSDRIVSADGVAESMIARAAAMPANFGDQAYSGSRTATQTRNNPSEVPQGKGGRSYLDAHFSLIRGRLKECLYYPSIARKRGWSGRVMVAFTIYPDGRAENLEIQESCGFSLLDKSALKTVRDACPFPKPPMTARITIPILFQLND